MEPGLKLRQAFESPDVTLVASVHDALSTQLAELAGYPVAVLGGATVTNNLLGLPDGGFLTLPEMEFVLLRTAAVCEIPIMIDADTGYGGAINVYRTVRTLEQAGAASIFISDQENPYRTGSDTLGVAVVSPGEMVGKLKAACDARRNDSFVVFARCDAWGAHEGVDRVIERAQQYVEAGADGLFAAGSFSIDEMRRIATEVPARFHMGFIGMLSGEQEPTRADWGDMGYNTLTIGMRPLQAGLLTTLRYFEEVKQGLNPETKFQAEAAGSPLEDWQTFTGFDWLRQLEERYLPPELVVRRYGEPTR